MLAQNNKVIISNTTKAPKKASIKKAPVLELSVFNLK
jgi:hypothetical protein